MSVQSALLAQLSSDASAAAACAARRPDPEALRGTRAEQELAELDPLVSAALLVASAFRMRDESALIATLRLLASAVAAWEVRQPEPANDA